MKNRAKCKNCQSVLESFHRHDYVTCECGSISIDGGLDYLKCYFDKIENFIRLDDDDKEIAVSFSEEKQEFHEEIPIVAKEAEQSKMSKKDYIDHLQRLIDTYEAMPDHVLRSAVNHSDLYSVLLLLKGLFSFDQSAIFSS